MRGRKPIPTSLKILRGSPDKRRLPENEPAPPAEMPDCPPHLDAEAKAEWQRTAPIVFGTGCLTLADRACFAAYCQCWSRWVAAEAHVQQFGTVLVAKETGSFYQNPYVPVANRALVEMRAFAVEFGLTPSSRARVKAGPAKVADPLEVFIGAG